MKTRCRTIYQKVQRLAEVARACVLAGKTNLARKCCLIAQKLYAQGGKEAQIAVANIFVFSLGNALELQHQKPRHWFSEALYREYVQQINSSGV